MTKLATVKVTNLPPLKARAHFLKHRSYVTFDLPYYFDFNQLLIFTNAALVNKKLTELCRKRRLSVKKLLPKNYDKVNYLALTSKDGKYSWRPMQIIHPVLYVDLVRTITEPRNWLRIRQLFKKYENNAVVCESIPLQSQNHQKSDSASQVANWWEKIEQESLVQSLKFDFVFSTDITDCYGSIYTHSFEWALNIGGKKLAKSKKARGLRGSGLGTDIDIKLQGINYGQTNGIPQGSELMNLLAEVILGYADSELSSILDTNGIDRKDYKILRFRDDYRVFVNDSSLGHLILKELNVVLAGLGFKMNANKTAESNEVITASIKPEKLDMVFLSPAPQKLQKEALRIYQVGKKYPNAGLVSKLLGDYYDTITLKKKKTQWNHVNVPVLISIFCQIAVHSPKTISWNVAIISALLEQVQDYSNRKELIELAIEKLKKIPNSGLLEVWLQRLSATVGINPNFDDVLTQAATERVNNIAIWNSTWLKEGIRRVINLADVSNLNEILKTNGLPAVVSREEVELFRIEYNF